MLHPPENTSHCVRALQVSLDLASFELVKDSAVLVELLREGCVDLVFCNEEEAQALAEVATAVFKSAFQSSVHPSCTLIWANL